MHSKETFELAAESDDKNGLIQAAAMSRAKICYEGDGEKEDEEWKTTIIQFRLSVAP